MYPTTFVHLTYTSNGKALAACLGDGTQYKISGVTHRHPGFQLTGDPRAVTCPDCKKSKVFQEVESRLPR